MIEKYLESTNLNERVDCKDIRNFVNEAIQNKFYGICTYLHWSNYVNDIYHMYGCDEKCPKRVYVIGFPDGNIQKIKNDLELVKISKGDEFDVVIPLIEMMNYNYGFVLDVLRKVRDVTKDRILKVIIETAIAKDNKIAIEIAQTIGADFIKTNTGRYKRKSPLEDDIKFIQSVTKLPIKASGGISDYITAKNLIDMGVKRIGTSNALKILQEENGK